MGDDTCDATPEEIDEAIDAESVRQHPSEGHRQLVNLKASGPSIGSTLGVSKQVVSIWRRGGTVSEEKQLLLEKHYGIPRRAWSMRANPSSIALQGSASRVTANPAAIAAGSTLADVDELLAQLREARRVPNLTEQTLARLASTSAQLLTLRHKLTHDAPSDEAKLLASPMWAALKTALAKALKPFPDAARAVAAALQGVGDTQ